MTNHFYFHFSSNDVDDDAGAMLTLDYDLATHAGVSEIFYGYRRNGEGFIIEGMVYFGVDVGDNEVHQLLHGFEVRRYEWSHHAHETVRCVTAISLFTKFGTAWDYDYVHLHIDWNHQNMLDYYNDD